ncbi:MAG: RICIN domain-containing protein [Paludibacter sp.]
MRKSNLLIIIMLCVSGLVVTEAQTTSVSSNLVAQPIPDRTVSFSVAAAGVSKPIIWGLDLAWLSEANIRRGIAFMGADRVDIVRASFQPTLPLVNGDLQASQINDLNSRLNLIDLTGTKTKVVLNCDHPSVDASYLGNAVNWALLIDATTKRVQARGRKVISVSPFNEPDYGWGQYTGANGQLDFYNIAGELRKNTRFDSIRICGGNTLNCDQALPWYNYLKNRLEEGNTHQLAGSFDNFASFYQTVRANGDHATGDELHNVMEAMVGVEYGMQTGIWWGTAELARGEFVKASNGVRLGYAEHRPNWTAASVYRNLDGKVQAFAGTSERQAVTTTYRFVSKDRDVYYDGYGPQREYTMVMPGGTGYQTGQTNAERVVNITWGDDIQPVVNGRYVLVNRMSSKVMEPINGSGTSGANICQRTYKSVTYQQWNVTPVDSRIGGDFSYFTLSNVSSSKVPDVLNFSLDNGGSIILWDNTKNVNQQWYLEYAEDGWFYIRNRNSAKCMEVAVPYITEGANVQQRDKNGGLNQQWRFLPVGAPVEFTAPTAPANLVATANAVSIRLDWTASPETDVAGYTVFRSETAGGPYNTIARNVNSTSFVDNTATPGKPYFYSIKSVDNSLNRSIYSNETSATASGTNTLVAHYQFTGNTQDSTLNLNHSAPFGGTSFVTGKIGSQAIAMNGTNAFVQLPATVANSAEITIATWVYWNGITSWQRIFDFGNDQTQYMFLTPRSSTGQMRFCIKNGGTEQILNVPVLPYVKWTHVAITLGSTGARVYVNGVLAAESASITIRPSDFKPVLNYIGRSQFSDPLFNGVV